jgi:hypothetical protein
MTGSFQGEGAGGCDTHMTVLSIAYYIDPGHFRQRLHIGSTFHGEITGARLSGRRAAAASKCPC